MSGDVVFLTQLTDRNFQKYFYEPYVTMSPSNSLLSMDRATFKMKTEGEVSDIQGLAPLLTLICNIECML